MTITESLLKEIELGRKGKSHGYSLGMPKMESIIDGLTKRTMTIIGSNTGSGKTSYVLYAYLYRPLMEHLYDDNFRVQYFSLEMNAEMLFTKLLSTYIFETFHKELSLKEILSRKKDYILSDEDFNIVKQGLEWLKLVEQKVKVYDKSLTANQLYAILMKELAKLGTFSESENRKVFTPNNPDLVYEVIIDHIGLMKPTSGNKKKEIDDTIAYLITLRNMCNISPTIIQQINRDQGNIERFKAGRSEITLNDFKESSDTTDGADIVVSIYNPNRDKLNTSKGYNVKILGDKFRLLTVLKSRYGDSEVCMGVNYQGKINYWKELPLPEEIYDYNKYLTPNYILEKDVDEEKHEVDNSSKNEFKLIL